MWRELCWRFARWLLRVSGAPGMFWRQDSALDRLVDDAARACWVQGKPTPRMIIQSAAPVPESECSMVVLITDFGLIEVEVEVCPWMRDDDVVEAAMKIEAAQ